MSLTHINSVTVLEDKDAFIPFHKEGNGSSEVRLYAFCDGTFT